MMNKALVISGWVRKDPFGRIVLDECPSDHLHLVHAPTDPETGKPACRVVLDDLLTRGPLEQMIGKRGELLVTVSFEEDRPSGPIEEAIKAYAEGRRGV